MQSALIIVSLVVLSGLSSYAQPTKYTDCGSKIGNVSKVEVTPCNTPICVLKKGTNTSVAITFTTKSAVTSGKAVVHGVIAKIPIPFPLPDADLCKFTTPACPLKPNTTYIYKNNLEVKKNYPSINLLVEWELKNSKGDDITCIKLPVSIQ